MANAKVQKSQRAPASAEIEIERVVDALEELGRLLRADIIDASKMSALTQPMAIALGRLSRLPARTTVSVLARAMECNTGNLSVTLDRLENAGYVERSVGETDRRARHIRLTEKGRRVVAVMAERFRSGQVCSALRRLPAAEVIRLTTMITSISRTGTG